MVVPVRNGASLLVECLEAILGQTSPAQEVILVVAPSTDTTRQVADSLAHGSVRVLDNPAGDRGSGINVALESTNADLLAMVDAQSRLAPDYLEAAAQVLNEPGVAVAGGPMRPMGASAVGQAMASTLRSPFGVGDSQFHFEGVARDVESVYLGVYRRSAFDQVGRYNPSLLRTEDDDLNARVRAAGLRIRLDPAIRSTYRCRETLGDIWRQYFGYGYWKVALAAVRPSAIRLRHLIPAVFVVAFALAVVITVLGSWLPLLALGAAWLVAAVAFALLAPADSALARVLFPVVALVMHLAYGVGTLAALVSWPRLARQVRAA